MEIVIIRHGQSELNKNQEILPTYCGRYDTPLSDLGRKMAKQLQDNSYIKEIQKIYTSDLKRAIDTAKLAISDKPIEIRKEITERSLGIFEGRIIEDIKQKYPEYFRDKELINFRFDRKAKAPKGENYADVCDRARKFLDSLDLQQEITIGVFSHMHFIRCLLYVLLDLTEQEVYQLKIPHCFPIVVVGNKIGSFHLIYPRKKDLILE